MRRRILHRGRVSKSSGGLKVKKRSSLIHPMRTDSSLTICCTILLVGNLPTKRTTLSRSNLSISDHRSVPSMVIAASEYGDRQEAGTPQSAHNTRLFDSSLHDAGTRSDSRPSMDLSSAPSMKAGNLRSVRRSRGSNVFMSGMR